MLHTNKTAAKVFLAAFAFMLPFPLTAFADDRREVESSLRRIFEKRSFTIRNFYTGGKLQYDSKGNLVGRASPGYWSRDGFFEIARVTITPGNVSVFEGNRAVAVFNTVQGEFENQHTDKLSIEVQLDGPQLDPNAIIAALYKVFVSGKEKLADVAPPYWRRCLTGKIVRSDKRAPWECTIDSQAGTDNSARPTMWTPPPDTTLRTGMQLYETHEKILFFARQDTRPPVPLNATPPFLRWAQRRVRLDSACVIEFVIDEEGNPKQLAITTPVGMGVDDELIQAVSGWKFRPGTRDGKPVRVPAKALFELSQPSFDPFLLRGPTLY